MKDAGATAGVQKHEVPDERKRGSGALSRLVHDFSVLASPDSRPLMFAYGLCAGAVAYFLWNDEPALWWSAGACLSALVLWFALRRSSFQGIGLVLAVILLGASAGHLTGVVRSIVVASPSISSQTPPLMVEGWLAEIEPGSKGVRLRLDVHAIAGLPPHETPVFVRLTHRSRIEVAPGRFVRCWAVLRPPPAPGLPGDYDFQRQAWFEQLGAVGYVQGRCRGGTLGAPASQMDQMTLQLAAIRRNLALAVSDGAGERAGGFAAALVSGDRSLMKYEDQEALRRSGLAHLLAISGLHLAIVGGLVFLIVRRLLTLIEPLALRISVQKPAAVVALVACAAYLVMSGASVSTQRAFIMAAIVFGAVIFDRAAISLRTFAIALIAVVLLQPESVMAPGFQMSFAATGALIATYEAWRNHRSARERVLGPVGFSWASIVMTSVVAGLATAPYALYHFDRLAGYGFLANLIAMPLVSFLTAPAAALAFLLSLVGLEAVGLRFFGYSLEAVLAVAHYFAALDTSVGGSSQPMPGSALALLSAGLALAIAARGAARPLLLLACMIPAIWGWVQSPRLAFHWSLSGTVYVANQRGDTTAVALVKGDGLAPLRFSQRIPVNCETSPCTFEIADEASLLLSSGQPSGTDALAGQGASVTLARGGMSETFHWNELQVRGPLTGYVHKGQISIAPTAPCRQRPWRECADPTSIVSADE